MTKCLNAFMGSLWVVSFYKGKCLKAFMGCFISYKYIMFWKALKLSTADIKSILGTLALPLTCAQSEQLQTVLGQLFLKFQKFLLFLIL